MSKTAGADQYCFNTITDSTITSRIVHLFELYFLLRSQCDFHGASHDPDSIENQASSMITGIEMGFKSPTTKVKQPMAINACNAI